MNRDGHRRHHLHETVVQRAVEAAAAEPDSRSPWPATPCGIRSPRTCWRPATTSGRSRSCSATERDHHDDLHPRPQQRRPRRPQPFRRHVTRLHRPQIPPHSHAQDTRAPHPLTHTPTAVILSIYRLQKYCWTDESEVGLVGAVGFDLGDTLVEYEGVPLNWQREYPVALAAMCAAFGEQVSDDQLASGIRVLLRYNTRVTPRTHEVDDRLVFGELLCALGLRSELPQDDFDRGVDAFFSIFRGRARVVPGAVELVSALRSSGVRLGVLTDVPYAMPRRLVAGDLAAAGLDALLDSTLTSSEVGMRKPDAAGFLALAARLDSPVHEIVFVGNERKDVEGATAAGAKAILLWREATPVPEWGQILTVGRLSELYPSLGEM